MEERKTDIQGNTESVAEPNTIADKENRLSVQKVWKLLLEFSVPAIVGVMLNAMYNLIDTAFLGNALPDGSGVAVTTLAFPVMMLLLAFVQLPGMGGNALAAIYLGKKDKQTVEKILGNTVFLLFCVAALVALCCTFFIKEILEFLSTPEPLHDQTGIFVQIICYGFICQCLSFGLNNFLRTDSRPKMALVTMVVCSCVCILFNAILVMGLNMGVAGSAIATVLGQGSGAIPIIYYFTKSKKSTFKLYIKNLVPQAKLIGKILLMGLASFAMNLATAVIGIVFNWMVTIWGPYSEVGVQGALASIGVAQKVSTFLFMPFVGLAMGAQPIIGYNFGARNWSRVIRALCDVCITSFVVGLILFVTCEIFPSEIVTLFGINDELHDYAELSVIVYMLSWPLVGVYVVAASYFQSSGQPIKSAILELTRQIIILIPLYIVLPNILLYLGWIEEGLFGIVIACPVSDAMAFVITTVFLLVELFKLFKWKKNPELADPKI